MVLSKSHEAISIDVQTIQSQANLELVPRMCQIIIEPVQPEAGQLY